MALSIPKSLGEAGRRMKHNICYYHTSYAILIFFIFFLPLFGNEENPIVLIFIHCIVDVIAILAVVWFLTTWALLLLDAVWLNFLVSILIGSALAGFHSLFWETEYLQHLDHDDQEANHQDGEQLEEVVGNYPTTTPTASDADQQRDHDHERVVVAGSPTTTIASDVAY